jgi:hypothetical protein
MSAREAAANLLMIAGTAAIAYAIVYTILNQQPKATASATKSCCAEEKGCCAEEKATTGCCAEQSKGCCAPEQKPDVEACRAAYTKAKKDLAHAENKHSLGQMPKRMMEAVRRKEVAAKAALDAAVAAA